MVLKSEVREANIRYLNAALGKRAKLYICTVHMGQWGL
jgi:hypothetical protein